ncbi:MAG TPA: tetratricopeptide repeat protein [Gemmatimonadaceae bacterium]|nr:tetratricopeptide repeat protein [Gemmatimonadaceae bacterium]
MSNVPKLKKRAGEFEQKKQFDKALAVYLQILQEVEGSEDEADVALFNRVGDLMLRQGNVAEAVDHYERAVDLYSEGGFFNNAIALCNKILRNAPGRNSIYYKLGKISAKKGFTNDAKQNFLEYADRMQKAGRLDEAFRALKEFADLCPDQDDIRLMLADQLVKKDRKGEAIEQLQTLYERYQSEGRASEARATLERMKAIDPNVEPQAPGNRAAPKRGDLVFLDVGIETTPPPAPRPSRNTEPPRSKAPPKRSHTPVKPSLDGLPMLDTDPPAEEPISHGSRAPDADEGVDASPGLLAGFEQTALGAEAAPPPVSPIDIEPTALTGRTGRAPSDLPLIDSELSVPDVSDDEAVSLPGELPMIEIQETESLRAATRLDLIMPEDEAVNPLADLNASGSAIEPDEAPLHPDPSRSSLADGTEWEIRLEDTAFLGDEDTPSGGPDLPLIQPTFPDEVAAAEPESTPESRAALVERLRDAVADDPGNWPLHRQLGEALLEDGDREGGIDELEIAMVGFESTSDHASARAVADEILHLDPNSVRHHQKRVEYSFLLNDKSRLVDAYLQLADCLFRNGHEEKAQAVYQRVIDIAPDDVRAQAALEVFGESQPQAAPTPESTFAPPPQRAAPPPAPPAAPRPAPPKPATRPVTSRESLGALKDLPLIEDMGPPAPKREPLRPVTGPRKEPPRAEPPAQERRRSEPVRQNNRPEPKRVEKRPSRPVSKRSGSDDDFVNLSDWLSEEKTPKSTRMVADVREPESDQVDFTEMLERFKQGIAENVSDEDHEAHYDLGVAYKEMGLLDEAIAEFQKALRGEEHRIRTFEALGQCFIEKGQYQIAVTILSRAPLEPGATDEQLVGVLYLLGYASEALQKWNDALAYYERVFAVDITFRDVNDRLAALERVAR